MTKEELLDNIDIVKTSESDIDDIINLFSMYFGINDKKIAKMQLTNTNAMLNESVKVIDKRDGKIYGILIFSDFPIYKGSPIMLINNELGKILMNLKQVNGFVFIIDEILRGTGVDKKMLQLQKEFINSYDFIWAAVGSDLNTHKYWKRIGFKELFSIEEATFYILFNKKKISDDIYNLVENLRNEKNNS